MKKLVLLSIALFFVFSGTRAQGNTVECLAQLQDIYRKEQEAMKKLLAEGKVWHMKYSLETKVYNPMTESILPSVTEGELIASKDFRYTSIPSVEVYMDQKDMFTIDRTGKTVVHTASPKGALSMTNPYFDLLNDSTLKAYKVSGCLRVKEQNRTVTRYDMVPADKQRSVYHKISFYVQEGASTFYKIHTDLNPAMSEQIRAYTMVVTQLGVKNNASEWVPVRKKVMLAGGKLKAPYAGYQYKNMTTSTKNAAKNK